MTPPRVLVVGDVMRDIVVTLAGPVRRGTDQAARVVTVPGGAAANLAAWLARDGVAVRLLACVGRADHAAEGDRLRGLGIEPALVAHPALPTGALVALVEPDGERSFLTDRGANDGLAPNLLPPGLLDGVGHLHLSGYALVGADTRAAALALVGQARARAIPVSLDPGSDGFVADLGPGRVLDWAAGAELCAVNEAEAAVLAGTPDPAAQVERLRARFALVLVKRGARGASAYAAGGQAWHAAAPAVTVRDTIGAGDAFLAGFLAARLRGETVPESLGAGVARGALAVSQVGGAPPMA